MPASWPGWRPQDSHQCFNRRQCSPGRFSADGVHRWVQLGRRSRGRGDPGRPDENPYRRSDAQNFIERGNLVLGICNGFQVLVNLGLLPGFDHDYDRRQVALTYNDCGNFRDQWVRLRINAQSPCVFTKGIEVIDLPVRHGEGKFYAETDVIARLESTQQVVMQYAASNGQVAGGRFPENPNGSILDIAGICDPTGRIFGLMPHPEAYNHPANHPDWFRERELNRRQGKSEDPFSLTGIRMFQNAADYLSK